MITAEVANDLILNHKKRTLEIDELVVGAVRIPAGVYARRFRFAQIRGSLVVGGYSVAGARTCFQYPATAESLNRPTGKWEFGGDLLAPRRKGTVPIAADLEIKASINAEGNKLGLFATKVVHSEFAIHVVGSTNQGVLLDRCYDVALSGSASKIGVPTITGQGYAAQLRACAHCEVFDWSVFGARSAAMLSHAGSGNAVVAGSGFLWTNGIWADVHGFEEIGPRFDCPTVRLGNPSYSGLPKDVVLGPKVEFVSYVDEHGVVGPMERVGGAKVG